MSDSFSADPAELRISAAKLQQEADEVERMMQEMKAVIADLGRCWGDDELGETFGQSYEPDSERGMRGFRDLVADLRSMSNNLGSSADAFEQQDSLASQLVYDSNPVGRESTDPTAPSAGIVQPPGSTEYHGAAGDPTQRPTTADRPIADPAPWSESANSPGFDPQQSAEAGEPDEPGTAEPFDAGSPGDQADDGTPEDTSDLTPAAGNVTPQQGLPAAPPEGKRPEKPSPAGGRAPSARPATESPGSRNKADTPWSKPSAAPAPATAPPRVSSPHAPTRPPREAKPVQPKRSEKRSKPRVVSPANKPTDPEAMRIAREMAARHGLTIAGFESAGVDAQTVQDIADAVDTVLIRYPTVLRGIEISDVTSPLSTIENRAGAALPETVAPWIVLARTAAADPRLLAARARPKPGSDTPTGRPMYTAILRELGSAFDLIGGFRARREAQRALITEYLRLFGAHGETLGQVVGGYKRWRAQLGDDCFDHGVFAPARALACGFAEVESSYGAASDPAQVLHRTLVAISGITVRVRKNTRSGWKPDTSTTPAQA